MKLETEQARRLEALVREIMPEGANDVEVQLVVLRMVRELRVAASPRMYGQRRHWKVPWLFRVLFNRFWF